MVKKLIMPGVFIVSVIVFFATGGFDTLGRTLTGTESPAAVSARTDLETIEMGTFGRTLTDEERVNATLQAEQTSTTDYQCVSVMYLDEATNFATNVPTEGDLAIITIHDYKECDDLPSGSHLHIQDISKILNIHEVHDLTTYAVEEHNMP